MRRIVVILISVFILIVSLLAWLGFTESGLSFTLAQLKRLVPELSVQKTVGRFYDGAVFKQINYQIDDSSHLSISHLTLSWQAMHLLSGRLVIDKLLLGDVVMTQSLATSNGTAVVLPNINMPVVILLKQLSIDSFTLLDQTQNKNQLVSGLELQIKLSGDKLNIPSLSIEYEDNTRLELSGNITLSSQYNTDLVYQWTVIDPRVESITAEGNITGNLAELKIEQQLLKPVKSSQILKVFDVLGQFNWEAEIQVPQLVIAEFVDDQPGIINNFIVKASGDLSAADLVIDSQFKQIDTPELSLHSQSSTRGFENWITDTSVTTADGMKLFINGDINQVLTSPALAIEGQWRQLAWPLIKTTKIVHSEQGDFSINGNAEHYTISIAGNLEAEKQEFSWQADVQGTSSQIDLTHLKVNGLQGESILSGWFDWQAESKYTLRLNWQDIIIPKAWGPLNLSTKSGELNLSGNRTSFTVTSAVKLTVDDTLATINLSGIATDKGFDQLTIKTTTNSGDIDFNGQILWLDKFKLNGRLNLANINPVIFAPQWPGNLSGEWILTVDNLNGDTADIRLDGLDVTGILRQRPVHLKGDLSYLQQHLNIPKLQLLTGKSEISVNGDTDLKDSFSLNWTLNSPDLADIYPDLTGQINAEGSLSGTVAAPVLIGSLSGQKIVYSDLLFINKVTSDFSIDMRPKGKVTAQMILNDINIDDLKGIDSKLTIVGTSEHHQLLFKMHNKNMDFSGELSAMFTDNEWQGQLANLKLEQAQAGLWGLSKQGSIIIGSDEGQLEEHCLQSVNGEVCLQAKYSPEGNWHSTGQFNNVPMSVLHAFSIALKPVEGQLNGYFEIKGKDQYPLSGQGEIKLDKAKLLLTTFDQQQLIPLQTAKLNFQLTDENTTAKVQVIADFKGVSALTGEVCLPVIKTVIDDPDKATLKGSFKTEIEDLSVFDGLNAQYENLQGYLNVNLLLAGSLKTPAASGQIIMDNASVEIPSLGLTLSEMHATVNGSIDKGILFSYRAESGNGHFVADGKFINKDQHWQLDANLKGDDVELVNLPAAYVIASHDLNLSLNDHEVHITGSVIVPEAELAPLQFNMPISPSKDVVILTNEPALTEKPFQALLDINITLGEKVKVAAVGFNGRLTGNLLVNGDANKLLLGSGTLFIKEGQYVAYGQKLTVDDGEILFSGGALDNPQLNIEALRKTETFTAGLQLRESADNPQVTLFSTPPMSEDNILAHIILGRAIGDASVADAALLAAASTGLGIKGGGQMGDRIASTFGLDSIEIAGDGGEDTALQIGKYLSPKLYLGYGIGIFEPITTIIMRYKLTKIWSLRAESGIETSVDFLYTHER
jgi:translocation and assembly module TamB